MIKNLLPALALSLISSGIFASIEFIEAIDSTSYTKHSGAKHEENFCAIPLALKEEILKRHSNLTLNALMSDFQKDLFLKPWCRTLRHQIDLYGPLMLEDSGKKSISLQFFLASTYEAMRQEKEQEEIEKKEKTSRGCLQKNLMLAYDSIKEIWNSKKEEKRKALSKKLFQYVLDNPENSVFSTLLKANVYLRHGNLILGDFDTTMALSMFRKAFLAFKNGDTQNKTSYEKHYLDFVGDEEEEEEEEEEESEASEERRNEVFVLAKYYLDSLTNTSTDKEEDLLNIIGLAKFFTQDPRCFVEDPETPAIRQDEFAPAEKIFLRAERRLKKTRELKAGDKKSGLESLEEFEIEEDIIVARTSQEGLSDSLCK